MTLFNTLKWALAGAALASAFAAPALATSSLECSGVGADAGATVLFGAGPMLNAIDADVYLDDRFIATRPFDNAERAYILQFKGDDKSIYVELMDDQADKHLATLRVLRHMDEDGEPLQVGILHIKGKPPVSVNCEGP